VLYLLTGYRGFESLLLRSGNSSFAGKMQGQRRGSGLLPALTTPTGTPTQPDGVIATVPHAEDSLSWRQDRVKWFLRNRAVNVPTIASSGTIDAEKRLQYRRVWSSVPVATGLDLSGILHMDFREFNF
jgi:hypothetical protein